MLLLFLIMNAVEFCLWLFGLLTLRGENGDMVRDSMLSNGFSAGDEERFDDNDGGIGTLK